MQLLLAKAITMPLVFKYLNLPFGLGGRGGVQRFFLLSNNIEFTEENFDMPDFYATEKERMVSSGENPCAAMPIIYASEDDKTPPHLIQHIAASRYLARLNGVTKDNSPLDEYVQDLVADEYQGFRDLWAQTAFSGTDDDKAKYKADQLPAQLKKFEALYSKYKQHEVYLSVSKTTGAPLWGDAALYGLLRDNTITGFLTPEDLKEKYPTLGAMFEAYGKIETVKAWVDKAVEK